MIEGVASVNESAVARTTAGGCGSSWLMSGRSLKVMAQATPVTECEAKDAVEARAPTLLV